MKPHFKANIFIKTIYLLILASFLVSFVYFLYFIYREFFLTYERINNVYFLESNNSIENINTALLNETKEELRQKSSPLPIKFENIEDPFLEI